MDMRLSALHLSGIGSLLSATNCIATIVNMRASGISVDTRAYFMAARMIIAVPTGIGIFSWITAKWDGSSRFRTPKPFAFGFIFNFVFTVGGVTGVKVANLGVDVILHNADSIAAHFHYVLGIAAASRFSPAATIGSAR